MDAIQLEGRLKVLETEAKEHTRILKKLEDMPVLCSARGVQLEALLKADLPQRVQTLEDDFKGYRKVAMVTITTTAALLTHKWWGAIFLALQKATI